MRVFKLTLWQESARDIWILLLTIGLILTFAYAVWLDQNTQSMEDAYYETARLECLTDNLRHDEAFKVIAGQKLSEHEQEVGRSLLRLFAPKRADCELYARRVAAGRSEGVVAP